MDCWKNEIGKAANWPTGFLVWNSCSFPSKQFLIIIKFNLVMLEQKRWYEKKNYYNFSIQLLLECFFFTINLFELMETFS